MNKRIQEITKRITKKSEKTRKEYLARCELMRKKGPERSSLSCSNLAHGFAACNKSA